LKINSQLSFVISKLTDWRYSSDEPWPAEQPPLAYLVVKQEKTWQEMSLNLAYKYIFFILQESLTHHRILRHETDQWLYFSSEEIHATDFCHH
jgi:hypothetical protein